ncbi:hypothetical protein ACFFUB_14610 [Algimonas porphyrae]|uniref:Rcc01698-like C-terminal domain-containing protein n=1 Tax=Algimonas porphyrae TaxID=1128113 RepID=A0ABQ5UYL1_9PROT|nr:hypothetical protein [Algimonas porphyrae]GLQ19658.1 hypothetical protein GCM10007854_06130 [Algimonas porphyrae]
MLNPFEPVTIAGPEGEQTLTRPLRLGATLSAFPARSALIVDEQTSLTIFMPNLAVSSVSDDDVLHSANRFAIETPLGWEIIAARDVTLVGAHEYALSHLLRGLDGTDIYQADPLASGARILWLGSGVETLALSADWRGTSVTVTGMTQSRAAQATDLIWQDLAGVPLHPVHATWDSQRLSWIGRDRAFTGWESDADHLRYRVRLYRGETIETVDTTQTFIETSEFDRAEIVQLGPDGRESLMPETLNVGGA